jgi:hypothetical protein
MRKFATWLTLAGLAFSASGLALALHEHECAAHGERHEHQDCVLHFALLAGFGMQAEAPVVSPALRVSRYIRPPLGAEHCISRLQPGTITPRGPPPHPFDVA